MRILSAINMAQMDILGQASGLPLYRLIGGKTRPSVKVYNTTTNYWAINETRMGPDTEKIVRFLLDRGIKAMKMVGLKEKVMELCIPMNGRMLLFVSVILVVAMIV